MIGVLNYCGSLVIHSARIICPLHQWKKRIESRERISWEEVTEAVHLAYGQALEAMVDLGLLGGDVEEFTLETDWSSGSQGYLLFAKAREG